ncbi:hypothetical protein T492DRAFT_839352 [Pavlovales sp. CCMP2436]|nr:hypothetical protein T492DRAFT_839352 [Pavlovales sp. CCMP2436]
MGGDGGSGGGGGGGADIPAPAPAYKQGVEGGEGGSGSSIYVLFFWFIFRLYSDLFRLLGGEGEGDRVERGGEGECEGGGDTQTAPTKKSKAKAKAKAAVAKGGKRGEGGERALSAAELLRLWRMWDAMSSSSFGGARVQPVPSNEQVLLSFKIWRYYVPISEPPPPPKNKKVSGPVMPALSPTHSLIRVLLESIFIIVNSEMAGHSWRNLNAERRGERNRGEGGGGGVKGWARLEESLTQDDEAREEVGKPVQEYGVQAGLADEQEVVHVLALACLPPGGGKSAFFETIAALAPRSSLRDLRSSSK